MKKYKDQIEMGFISENELDSFLYYIADDETLSARQILILSGAQCFIGRNIIKK